MAGFILVKDKRVVLLYTNDLQPLMKKVYHGNDPHAVYIVHGLEKIHHWTGSKYISHSQFLAPVPVAAYNKFMNGVNCFDQLQLTNATCRKEQRVNMSLFTYVLDIAGINAFQVYKKLCNKGCIPKEGCGMDVASFKCKICQSLTDPYEAKRKLGKGCKKVEYNTLENPHVILNITVTENSKTNTTVSPLSTSNDLTDDDQIIPMNRKGTAVEEHILLPNLSDENGKTNSVNCVSCVTLLENVLLKGATNSKAYTDVKDVKGAFMLNVTVKPTTQDVTKLFGNITVGKLMISQ